MKFKQEDCGVNFDFKARENRTVNGTDNTRITIFVILFLRSFHKLILTHLK